MPAPGAPGSILMCAVALAAAAPCGGGSSLGLTLARPAACGPPPLRSMAVARLRGGQWGPGAALDGEFGGEGLELEDVLEDDDGGEEESGEADRAWEEEERKVADAMEATEKEKEKGGVEESRSLDSDEEWWEQNKGKFVGLNKTWAKPGEDLRNQTVVGELFEVGDMVVPTHPERHRSKRMEDLLERSKNKEGVLDDEEAWWNAQDDDEVGREAIQEFLDETVCCGTGPHTMIGYRFGGRKVRDRSLYARDNETDAEMLQRHFFGFMDNATLMGLHKLSVAVECRDHAEIERLVMEEGVDPNGLIDTVGWERAIHFAAWNGDRDTCRLLVRLGACPNALNFYNQSAMHRAASGGYTALCDDLHSYGALPLEEDALSFTPPAWAAAFNKNETTQWFYAKFAYRNGSGFPLGPPPFYGLEQNVGYDWCVPYADLANETTSYFIDTHLDKSVKDEEDVRGLDTVWTERCKILESKVEYMEEDCRKAEARQKEIRAAKEVRRKEMGEKRKKVAMGEFPEFFRDMDTMHVEKNPYTFS